MNIHAHFQQILDHKLLPLSTALMYLFLNLFPRISVGKKNYMYFFRIVKSHLNWLTKCYIFKVPCYTLSNRNFLLLKLFLGRELRLWCVIIFAK